MAMVGGSIGWAGRASVDLQRAEGVGDGGLGEAGDGDDVAGRGLVDRLALQAAEGQQLGDAAALDLLAVARQRLDRPCRAPACRDSTRPVSRRPRNGSASISTASSAAGSSARGLGRRRRHVARRSGRTAGARFSLRLGHVRRPPSPACRGRRGAGSRAARRWRPGRRTGRRRRSAPGPDRRAGRSTLFSTTIGRRPSFSALPSTNLVCGITPSSASTSSRQPSTMPRMRSTSPPKSAWPGVSMMLMRVSPASPCQSTEVHLARMVMPRSRSWSLESMARSTVRLVGAEGARLGEQLVDQGGLAVVDVGDDGDVSEVHFSRGERSGGGRPRD